MYLATVAKTPK